MTFNKGWLSKFMVFFGYFMAAVYIGLGAMLFFPKVYPNIPGVLKFSFALFFIAYGFFRLVKLITKKAEPND
jgi:predicted membrane protein